MLGRSDRPTASFQRPDAVPRGRRGLPHEEYLKAHADLLHRDEWIIDGFGSVATAWERFAHADTLVYVDLPVATHYWWVTKRLFAGQFANPQGWPDRSPIWSSTISFDKVIMHCHRTLTPKYRQLIGEAAASKRVHHIRSKGEIKSLLDDVARAYGRV